MNVDIKKQFVPTVDEAAIVAFEASLGYAFPRDYREFLLRFNGANQIDQCSHSA
jgi:cell wall assembly regulator SMI1